MHGCFHSVERFGTVDGDGIRYVLFLSGCNLRCQFCHNPDTWIVNKNTISIEGVMADLLHYRHFYDASGGGLTVSGGEPLLQADFVAELFRTCREQNIHTTIDTSGHCSEDNVLTILPYTDAALFSIKAVAPDKHRWLTGFDNTKILHNLNIISAQIPVTLRYVVIPRITTLPEDISLLAELVHSLPRRASVELLPYHTYGRKKWEALHIPYALDSVPDASAADVAAVAARLQSLGVTVLHQPKEQAKQSETA